MGKYDQDILTSISRFTQTANGILRTG